MDQEHRRKRRYKPTSLLGSLLYRAQVEVTDISAGGASVESAERLAPGKIYRFRVLADHQPIEVGGRIVWCRVHSHKQQPKTAVTFYKAGIRFEDTLTDTAEDLRRFIEKEADFKLDTRYFLRFQFQKPISADVEGQHEFRVRVLSIVGMRIETDLMLQPEEVFEMNLRLDQDLLDLKGRIVNARQSFEDERLVSHLGVEFTDIPGESRPLLQSYIERWATPEA
jgi:hypothetical protein